MLNMCSITGLVSLNKRYRDCKIQLMTHLWCCPVWGSIVTIIHRLRCCRLPIIACTKHSQQTYHSKEHQPGQDNRSDKKQEEQDETDQRHDRQNYDLRQRSSRKQGKPS